MNIGKTIRVRSVPEPVTMTDEDRRILTESSNQPAPAEPATVTPRETVRV